MGLSGYNYLIRTYLLFPSKHTYRVIPKPIKHTITHPLPRHIAFLATRILGTQNLTTVPSPRTRLLAQHVCEVARLKFSFATFNRPSNKPTHLVLACETTRLAHEHCLAHVPRLTYAPHASMFSTLPMHFHKLAHVFVPKHPRDRPEPLCRTILARAP